MSTKTGILTIFVVLLCSGLHQTLAAARCMQMQLVNLTSESSGDDEGAREVTTSFEYIDKSNIKLDFDFTLQNDLSKNGKFKVELQQDYEPSFEATLSLATVQKNKDIRHELRRCSNIKLPLQKDQKYSGKSCKFDMTNEVFLFIDFAVNYAPIHGKWSLTNEDGIDVILGEYLVNIKKCGGDNTSKAPTPPDNNNKEPTPPDDDNKAPMPPDNDNKAPTPPENDNKAPTPPDNDNKAPTPPDNDNKAPTPPDNDKAPKPPDNDNKAPTPPENDNRAPTPPDNDNKTPTPPDNDNKAPTPPEKAPDSSDNSKPNAPTSPDKNNNNNVPTPPDNNKKASTPPENNEKAPTSPDNNNNNEPTPSDNNKRWFFN